MSAVPGVDTMQATDKAAAVQTAAEIADREAAEAAAARKAFAPGAGDGWPDPTPLPDGLPPVEAFDGDLLPQTLLSYVSDISERMQCPPDFPAVAVLTVLSAAVGRRCRIRPKRFDSWECVPNLWAMIIGRPGIMKSPPLQEVMRPLQQMQAAAVRKYEADTAEYQAGKMFAVEAERIAKDQIRKLIKAGKKAEATERAEEAVREDPQEPSCKRLIVNDATVEALGELLNKNPQGLLHFRDELTGFFRTLERQGHEADRAFYLECWNGDGSHTYDRIGRGTQHIEAACLSILGSIQPGPLGDLVRGLRGSGDDGLLQRFQLSVWPDGPKTWRNVDRQPNDAARAAFAALLHRLDTMSAESAPGLGFDEEAQAMFDNWRESLEIRLRNDSEHPAIEAHLAKYRSLVPSIALLLHLAEHVSGPVSVTPLTRAIAWALYLESHARRIYAPAISPDVDAARLLADKIKAGYPRDRNGKPLARFALRDIYRNGWSGLSTVEDATAAARVLEDYDWLRSEREETSGRTRTSYLVNPACLAQERRA